MLTRKPNRTNKFFFFLSACHKKMWWSGRLLCHVSLPVCMWLQTWVCSQSVTRHVRASLGRIGSSGHPPPAAGKHRAGEPAEKTGEFLQHFCRGVQPQPAVGSPRTHGCRVPPFVLQGPKEWTADVTSTGGGDWSVYVKKKSCSNIPACVFTVFIGIVKV